MPGVLQTHAHISPILIAPFSIMTFACLLHAALLMSNRRVSTSLPASECLLACSWVATAFVVVAFAIHCAPANGLSSAESATHLQLRYVYGWAMPLAVGRTLLATPCQPASLPVCQSASGNRPKC